MEYQKETGIADFEIHGYVITANQIQGRLQYAEKKMRDVILGHEGEPFSKLSTISEERIFECPSCHAKYSLATMRMSSDGRIECQNCGRLVKFEIEDSESSISD